MSNLVIVEHDNNEVAAATLHAVTAAQQIGGDIDLRRLESLASARSRLPTTRPSVITSRKTWHR
jgi:electron transfer flavoprotein alpha subunit